METLETGSTTKCIKIATTANAVIIILTTLATESWKEFLDEWGALKDQCEQNYGRRHQNEEHDETEKIYWLEKCWEEYEHLSKLLKGF